MWVPVCVHDPSGLKPNSQNLFTHQQVELLLLCHQKQYLQMRSSHITSFQTFYRALFYLKMFELHPPYSMNKMNGKIPNKSLLTLISLVQILKGILLTLFIHAALTHFISCLWKVNAEGNAAYF